MSEDRQKFMLNTVTGRVLPYNALAAREPHIVECDEKGNKIGVETDDANIIHNENVRLHGTIVEQDETISRLQLENANLRSRVSLLEQAADPDFTRREELNVKTRDELLAKAKELGIENPGNTYRKGNENNLVQAIINAEKAADQDGDK